MKKNKVQGGQVQSLTRAISILRVIARHPNGVRLGEIAANLDLAPSTVHRILSTLKTEKFVRAHPSSGHWYIGVEAFTIGNCFIQSDNILEFSQPYLKNLVRKFSETASLYIENEGEMVCMHQCESHNMVRAITSVGGRVKMHCSGSGKAVLAYWDNEDVDEIIRIHGLPGITEKTISTLPGLKRELKRVRKVGYAIDNEEVNLGVRCVAAPIFNHEDRAIAALSVSGLSVRMNKHKLDSVADAVKEAADNLSRDFGTGVSGVVE